MSLLAVHVSVACQGCIYYERLTVGVLWLRHLRSAYLSEMRGGLYRGSAVYAPLSLRDGRSSKHWAVGRLESRGAAVPKQGNTKFGKHSFTYSVPCVRSWGNFCLASRKQAGWTVRIQAHSPFVPLLGTGQTLLRIIIRIYPHIYIYTRIKKCAWCPLGSRDTGLTVWTQHTG